MDIYDYLKMDHKKVNKLFSLYETATTEKNKLEIFVMLKQELTVHADSEAETFYKALETHRKSEDEALHGEKEHVEIKAKLYEISKLHKVSSTMDKKIFELKELVKHHVDEEESKIFNIAKKVLNTNETHILKERMHDLKEKILNKIKEKVEETV